MDNIITNPSKEQMYQWYVVEKKTYRQIMKLIGTKNNRKIPKLLNEYNIPIRHGSEAVKTQWINNDERREKQGETFRESNKGRPSPRRKDFFDYKKRYKKYGLTLIDREIVNFYSYFTYICDDCSYIGVKTSKNSEMGCPQCAIIKRTYADQETVRAQRSKTKKWRKEVLNRDNHMCQKCGNDNDLRAHHIYNFAEYPDKRFDLSNGITLCKKCHDCGQGNSFHTIYGQSNNNEIQLEEFLKSS